MTDWDFDTYVARKRRARRLGYAILGASALFMIVGAATVFYWAWA